MSSKRDGSRKVRLSESASHPRLNVLVDSDVKTGKNSFVVNVNPGQYKLSLDVKRSKRSPIRISLSPETPKFPPPKRPVELLYKDNIPETTLRRLQSGKCHRKRFRWAPFCLGSSLVGDFISEPRECYGYDGLEHLARTNYYDSEKSHGGLLTIECDAHSKKTLNYSHSLKELKDRLRSGLCKLKNLVRPARKTGLELDIPVRQSDNCESVRTSIEYPETSCCETEGYDADIENCSINDIESFDGNPMFKLNHRLSSNSTECREDLDNMIFYNTQLCSLKAGISTDSMEINKILSEGLIITSSSPANCDANSLKREFHSSFSQARDGNVARCPLANSCEIQNGELPNNGSDTCMHDSFSMTRVNSGNALGSSPPSPEFTSAISESRECSSVSDALSRSYHASSDNSIKVRDRRAQSESSMGNGPSGVDRRFSDRSNIKDIPRKSLRKRYLHGIRDAFSGPSLSRSQSTSDSFLSSNKKVGVKKFLPEKLNHKRSTLCSNLADITNRKNNGIGCQKMTQWEQVPTTFNEDMPTLGTNVVGEKHNDNPETQQANETDSHTYENTYFQLFKESSPAGSDDDSTSSGSFTIGSDRRASLDAIFCSLGNLNLENSHSESSLLFHYEDINRKVPRPTSTASEDSDGTRFYSTLIPGVFDGPNECTVFNDSETCDNKSEMYQDVSYYFTTSEEIVLDSDNVESAEDSDQESAYKSFYFSTAGDSTNPLDDLQSNSSSEFESVYTQTPAPVYVNTKFNKPQKELSNSIRYAYSSPLHGFNACGVKSKPLRKTLEATEGWATSDSDIKSTISSSYASRQYHPEKEPKGSICRGSKSLVTDSLSRSSSTGSSIGKPPSGHDPAYSLSSSDVTSDSLYSCDSEDTFPEAFARESPDILLSCTPSLSSSGSSINARKPPVSPGSRDHSVPREGRSLMAPRRRCRSASNSGRLRPDSYIRPTSLLNPIRQDLSQESLDEARCPRFSCYLFDERAPNVEW